MIKRFKASKRAAGGFFYEQTSPCFPKACGSPSSRLWGILLKVKEKHSAALLWFRVF